MIFHLFFFLTYYNLQNNFSYLTKHLIHSKNLHYNLQPHTYFIFENFPQNRQNFDCNNKEAKDNY